MTIRWGLGPAFYYEWLLTSRRWQTYAGRCLFVGMLLAGLTLVWASKVAGESITDLRGLANVGEAFFYAIAGIQLSLVLLAAPAYTAGAICLDKSRGVLTHLLITDLSDTEIVLGKLAARLMVVLGLLFVTLPVLALATLLGGIAPEALLSSFLVTLGVAVLGCSLALTFSVFGHKTHEVLLASYLAEVVALLALPVWQVFSRPAPAILERFNPYWLAFAPYTHPQLTDFMDYQVFLGVCLGLSVWLIVLARLAIRPLVTGQPPRRSLYLVAGPVVLGVPLTLCVLAISHPPVLVVLLAVSAPALVGTIVWMQRGGSGPARSNAGKLFTPSRVNKDPLEWLIRAAFVGIQPSLDNNPVLWCEWRSRRSSGWMRFIGWIYACAAGFFAVLAVGQVAEVWRFGHEFPSLVNAFSVSIGMLLLTVTSVTAMAEDRSRGTLEVLMTTPVSSRSIVWAKWWAGFRRVPVLLVAPSGVALAVGVNTGRVGVVLLMLLLMLAYGAAVTSLGLALATWIQRQGRAIALSVTAYVLVTVGWVFAIITVMGNNSDPTGPGLALASPFWGPGLLTVEMQGSFAPFRNELMVWAILWIVVYLVVANVLLGATLLTFDRCLGRVNQNEFTA